jgi:UDP-glucose 4-epimerase|tara:strand:+ start:689 stop:1675 length:987 start_codon:yes stop_codon:yes gene_type:complete
MKSIVTGGAGFIGSHLVDRLLSLNHKVTVLDNFSTGRRDNLSHLKDKIKIIECDLSKNGNWVKNFEKTDWVFHVAGLADIVPSIKNPVSYFNSNVVSTLNIIQASKKNKVKRIVYLASASCYGLPEEYPTTEKAEIKPEYPYAIAKLMGEQLLMHWVKIYNLPAVSLRLFNVYGTRSRTSGTYGAVFGVFLAQKLANKPLTIVGDGNQTRDFTYVSDVVDAIICAVKSNRKGEIYNVGSGKSISVNRIVELLGSQKVTHIPKRPGEPDQSLAGIEKIKKDFSWKPKVTIEEGVKEILKNINYWKNAPVWTPSSIKRVTKEWFKSLSKK